MAIIHFLQLYHLSPLSQHNVFLNMKVCVSKNVSNVLLGVRDADILLEYNAEMPELNVEAVFHAVARLRYYYLF